jgi:hypothetical protein
MVYVLSFPDTKNVVALTQEYSKRKMIFKVPSDIQLAVGKCVYVTSHQHSISVSHRLVATTGG